jgi:preprotein translocase subunit SecA
MSEGARLTRADLPSVQTLAEREIFRVTALDRAFAAVAARAVTPLVHWRARRMARLLPQVEALGEEFAALDEAQLRAKARDIRRKLHVEGRGDEPIVVRAFALLREVSTRLLGRRPYPVQILGAHALLNGTLAEMNTGEGKTLTAALAATIGACCGDPVHVVTVNDYLARRDSETHQKLFEFFGLTVGCVVSGAEPPQRRAAYACDITYCTNKELAFDYLRDRLALRHARGPLRLRLRQLTRLAAAPETVMRGLHFAIVDEADSVLIDEARTPLILSRELPSAETARVYEEALGLARDLREGEDYLYERQEARTELTASGRLRLAERAPCLGGLWLLAIQREELVSQALTALHVMHRDEHYILRDGLVQIVDEYTGRVMADRFWTDGLHQMIELKEGCALSNRRATLARMTYQRFFRRYLTLAGLTGTAREVGAELWQIYRLKIVRVPTHRPSRRTVEPMRILPTLAEKWRAIAAEAGRLHDKGLPVLIGTRSVAASQQASEALAAAGLPHVVLNAAQDAAEAEIVARAGERQQITVATNMAGRGTDILIADAVEQSGGLQVIMSEMHDSGRIDRQLQGRCARQGQNGRFRAILSREDPLLRGAFSPTALKVLEFLARHCGENVWCQAMRFAQARAERVHSRMRWDLLKNDEVMDRALSFAEQGE